VSAGALIAGDGFGAGRGLMMPPVEEAVPCMETSECADGAGGVGM